MGGPSAPKTVRRDPEAEERKAAAKATKLANAERAVRGRSVRKSSTLSNAGGAAGTNSRTALAAAQETGKQTLG